MTIWLLWGSALSHPSLLQSPLSVQHIKTVQWPKQFTIFPFFFSWGTESLHHRLRLRMRFFWWQSDSFVSQLLVTHILLYKVHSQFSLLRQSSGCMKHITHLVHFFFLFLFFFFGTKSLHYRLKTKEVIFWMKLTPLWVSPQLPFLNSLLNLSSLTTQTNRQLGLTQGDTIID